MKRLPSGDGVPVTETPAPYYGDEGKMHGRKSDRKRSKHHRHSKRGRRRGGR